MTCEPDRRSLQPASFCPLALRGCLDAISARGKILTNVTSFEKRRHIPLGVKWGLTRFGYDRGSGPSNSRTKTQEGMLSALAGC